MIELTRLSGPQTSIWESLHDAPAFRTANEFSQYIEKLAVQSNSTFMSAILDFCATHKLEPSDVVSKINKNLKDKIEQDFRDLNYLPKRAQLDV